MSPRPPASSSALALGPRYLSLLHARRPIEPQINVSVIIQKLLQDV